MKKPAYSEEFLRRLNAITSKRPRIVIQHILKHGHITTEELEELYGYTHAPSTARDVREHGIPLESFSVKNREGRRIAAYRFGDPSTIRGGIHGGRKAFAKGLKELIADRSGLRCAICSTPYAERYLQIDHKVPYEVSGDSDAPADPSEFMLLCGSCNRAKSWSCEHCANWINDKRPNVCRKCYWGNPESYQHVALLPVRRADVVWSGSEVKDYDKMRQHVRLTKESIPEFVKRVIRKHLRI